MEGVVSSVSDNTGLDNSGSVYSGVEMTVFPLVVVVLVSGFDVPTPPKLE